MLWLLRHAEAAEGRPDEARPLTERGLSDARAIGLAIARMGIAIDTCLSSPKRRTMQTAELACEQIGVEVTPEPALAGGGYDPERLAAGLGETMLVGHNPSISVAVRELSGARVNMRAGGLAGIERGELVVLMTPDQLLEIARSGQVAA